MPRRSASSSNQKQRVIDTLHERILSGDLKEGDPLRQIPLSKEFGVAQTVIRESLQILERRGLVRSVEHLGVFVREFGPAELVSAYQVREVLEGLAAKLCCETVSRKDIRELEAAAQAIYDARDDASRQRRSELEYQFHQRFLELAENDTLLQLSEGYRFVGNLVATDRDPEVLLKEHLAIVSAVASNLPQEAETAARLHVAASTESIIQKKS